MNKKLTIKKTAEILGLKPSTARMILKRYKEDGIIFERKAERQGRES
jgi:DNA-binding Lrp family transcriptional regulator